MFSFKIYLVTALVSYLITYLLTWIRNIREDVRWEWRHTCRAWSDGNTCLWRTRQSCALHSLQTSLCWKAVAAYTIYNIVEL